MTYNVIKNTIYAHVHGNKSPVFVNNKMVNKDEANCAFPDAGECLFPINLVRIIYGD